MSYFYEYYFCKFVLFFMLPLLVVMGYVILDAFLFVRQTPMVIVKGRVTNSSTRVDHTIFPFTRAKGLVRCV